MVHTAKHALHVHRAFQQSDRRLLGGLVEGGCSTARSPPDLEISESAVWDEYYLGTRKIPKHALIAPSTRSYPRFRSTARVRIGCVFRPRLLLLQSEAEAAGWCLKV